jgi:glycosyltransferase involved in cell wall biosynthesis
MKVEKNVLIIAGVFFPEPVVSSKILFDLATELSVKHNVTVLRPKPTRPMGFEMPFYDVSKLTFKVIELNSYTHPKSTLIGRMYESFSMGVHSVEFIKKNVRNIDLIYNAPWQLVGRYMVAKIANKFNIPFIIPVQDVYPESIISKLPNWFPFKKIIISLLLPYDKLALLYSAKVHTISEKIKEYLIATRGVDKDKFLVVQNWQNEEDFIKFKNQNSSIKLDLKTPFTFMYLGNIGPLAGIEILVEAFISAAISNSILIIAGSGSAKEGLINKFRDYIPHTIKFLDVPDGKVPETQLIADVMVLTIKKGFSSTSVPSKLPAYMFSSKPIIVSVDKNSDTAQSILDSGCGWICESENVDMLAKSMMQAALTDETKLNQMGHLGYQYALNNFSRKNNLRKLLEACEDVLTL